MLPLCSFIKNVLRKKLLCFVYFSFLFLLFIKQFNIANMVDAKSYIGMYALNFAEPILVVSESKEFFELIQDIGTAETFP